MAIETFPQRQKAEHIYKTYFDIHSKHHIGFDMLDTIMFYSGMSQKDFEMLTKKFEEIGESLFKEINKFDKIVLNKSIEKLGW